MKYFFLLLSLFWAGLLGGGCANSSYQKRMAQVEKIYLDGEPESAARYLAEKIDSAGDDRLLYEMEIALLLGFAKKQEASNRFFLQAAGKADQRYKSRKQEILEYFISSGSPKYLPYPYERSLIHWYLALNFLELQKTDLAWIEIRKAISLQDASLKNIERSRVDNLATRILGVLIALELKEYQWALVEAKRMARLQGRNFVIAQLGYLAAFRLKDQQEIVIWENRLKKLNILPSFFLENKIPTLIVHELGRIPVKQSRGSLIEEPAMRAALEIALHTAIIAQRAEGITVVAAMAFLSSAEHPVPKYVRRSFGSRKNIFRLLNKNGMDKNKSFQWTEAMALAETMELYQEMEYKKIRTKLATRIAVKTIAALLAQHVAEKVAKEAGLGPFSDLIGAATGVATGGALMSLEKPDLRSWRSLPARIEISLNWTPKKSEDKSKDKKIIVRRFRTF